MNDRRSYCICFGALLILAVACQTPSNPEQQPVLPEISPMGFILPLSDSTGDSSVRKYYRHDYPFPMRLIEVKEPFSPFSATPEEQ